MKLDEVDTFRLYLAIRVHFTTEEYDFFERKGAIKNSSYKNLLSKKYHSKIYALSKQFDAKGLRDYFVANMLVEEGIHTFDTDCNGMRIYKEYIKRKEARTYLFKQEVTKVCAELKKREHTSFDDSLKVDRQQFPMLLRMFLGSYVSPETMCILNRFCNYIPTWDKDITDTILYPQVSLQLRKLNPFILIKDIDTYVKHHREICNEILGGVSMR